MDFRAELASYLYGQDTSDDDDVALNALDGTGPDEDLDDSMDSGSSGSDVTDDMWEQGTSTSGYMTDEEEIVIVD